MAKSFNFDLDIYILTSIYNASKLKKDITTYQLAKLYDWKDKKEFMTPNEKQHFFGYKSILIDYRIKSMAKEGFVRIEKNNKRNIFILMGEKLIKKRQFGNKFFNCFELKLLNGKWASFQI